VIHVAIPALDELRRLPACLDRLASQTAGQVRVWVCVNQPESWRDRPGRQQVFRRNQATLDWLQQRNDPQLAIIDKSSPGHGWPEGRGGVGWARKLLFDHVLAAADDRDLLVSLDADTLVEPDYLEELRQRLDLAPGAVGLSAPYYHPLPQHPLPEHPPVDPARDILRYELYLRHYLLCLLRSGSPWAYTALGSAMAVPVGVCRRVGGMSPRASGEDFYFLQKLRKFGPLLLWCGSPVRPAARYSDRVLFGTGPAMIAGRQGQWHRYPIYAVDSFREAARTVAAFPRLHRQTVETPLTPYGEELFGVADPWASLRDNHPTETSFVRACHERFDGLRLLRFLRLLQQERGEETDEERLLEGVSWYAPEAAGAVEDVIAAGGFSAASIAALDRLRDLLALREGEERKRQDRLLTGEVC
jgi:GT2 family glycosyltransferase